MKHKYKRSDYPGMKHELILPPSAVEELPLPVNSIQVLEALRDKTIAEEWQRPGVKRAVLFGIRLCIATLKREGINELVEGL